MIVSFISIFIQIINNNNGEWGEGMCYIVMKQKIGFIVVHNKIYIFFI